MELERKNTYLTAIFLTVLVIFPLVEGGCQEEIMQKAESMECLQSFGTYMMNIGKSGTDVTDENGIFQVVCSEEGRAAFDCLIDIMRQCPELMSGAGGQDNPMAALGQIEGFDMNSFLEEGALDATCALFVGPCSKVQECFTGPTHAGRMKRQEQPSSSNMYLLFQSQMAMMCGPYKQQMDCMLKALEDCPKSVVSKVEAQFEAALNISTSAQADKIVSYQDTKTFIKSQCAKLPSDDTCLRNVFLSQNFTKCDEYVSIRYSMKKNCTVHEMSSKCIQENVEPRCGKEAADFLTRNTHMIYPGIPNECNNDVSGSNIVQTSFGVLLMAAFFFIIS